MKFLIDENIRREVIEFIKDSGYDILILPAGTSDEEIAKTAQEAKRIILTHDRHFSDILSYPPKEYSGIIRIKIHPPIASVIITSPEIGEAEAGPKVSKGELDMPSISSRIFLAIALVLLSGLSKAICKEVRITSR